MTAGRMVAALVLAAAVSGCTLGSFGKEDGPPERGMWSGWLAVAGAIGG